MQESHLYQTYLTKAIPSLQKKFHYQNKHQFPVLNKVCLNIGLGEAVKNPKVIEAAQEQLSLICGQKAIVTRARKSIAGFKLREGMPIGCMVTLRKKKMWNFLDKLVHIALPRVRDFRGISPKSIDGCGNYTLGLKEQLIFPEIDFDKIDKVRGLSISINTTTKTNEECLELLKALGFPFRK